ncbi:hypothetical protein Pan54_47140 [Rubinisphaera italica]|uniref:Uncharacterized protein n=1 Tax=Rubinisphaera italica TaxID=2527969 RepID=A0A5C5XM37_9PLAN|nr:hypothetical protein Pan54_47140 [Rubinisphaera italica]
MIWVDDSGASLRERPRHPGFYKDGTISIKTEILKNLSYKHEAQASESTPRSFLNPEK